MDSSPGEEVDAFLAARGIARSVSPAAGPPAPVSAPSAALDPTVRLRGISPSGVGYGSAATKDIFGARKEHLSALLRGILMLSFCEQ